MDEPTARRRGRVLAGGRQIHDPATAAPTARSSGSPPAGRKWSSSTACRTPAVCCARRQSVRNHNFLVLDRAATGPEFTLSFPFQVQVTRSPDPKLAEIRQNRIVYLKTLEGEERVTFGIQGFGKDAKDYDVRVNSSRTGAGFRVTSDRPPASIGFWSIRSVISVEPFVDVSTEPGKTTTWKYRLYVLHEPEVVVR